MQTRKRLKIIMITCWVFFVVMCLIRISDISKYYVAVIQMATINVTITLLVLLSRLSLVFIDFSCMIFLINRSIVTFILFQAIYSESAGFEEADLKEMQDSLINVMYPAILLLTVNFKIELCATFPITLACIYYIYKASFTVDSDNMACYKHGE